MDTHCILSAAAKGLGWLNFTCNKFIRCKILDFELSKIMDWKFKIEIIQLSNNLNCETLFFLLIVVKSCAIFSCRETCLNKRKISSFLFDNSVKS